MYIVIFLLGTIFGSFGSVLLNRLHEKCNRAAIKGILRGFSQCPHCKKRLQAQHLIPLRSFFHQKGKCAFCKTPISREYPILEIASGLIFVFSYYLVFDIGSFLIIDKIKILSFIFRSITNRGLLLLLIQDFKSKELHMPIRIGITARILGRQFLGIQGQYQGAVIASLISLVVFGGIYLGAKTYIKRKYNTNQEGFGQGDIFLGFSLGALIPFIEQFNALGTSLINHFKIIAAILFIASILGICYAGILQLLKLQHQIQIASSKKIIIPFFPMLILAFWILLIYADPLISYLFG